MSNNLTLVTIDYHGMVEIKKGIKLGESSSMDAYNQLLSEADLLVNIEIDNITEGLLPPSGDAHDFYSVPKYAWINNFNSYEIRDGAINPQSLSNDYDIDRLNTMCSNVKTLLLAWFYSENKVYEKKAVETLRIWFIDKETKMNPNFIYSAYLPKEEKVSEYGIISGVVFIELIDHINLLEFSENWVSSDKAAIKAWFNDLLKYLWLSDQGEIIKNSTNNQLVWHLAQMAAYSIFTENTDYINQISTLAEKAIETQIAEDGSFPKELSRKDSFNYSLYCLKAFITLTITLDYLDQDQWKYKVSNVEKVQKALDFMIPYYIENKQWKYDKTNVVKTYSSFLSIYRLAKKAYPTQNNYLIAYQNIQNKIYKRARAAWLYGN